MNGGITMMNCRGEIVDLEITTEQFSHVGPWSGCGQSETQLCSRTFPIGSRWIASFPSVRGVRGCGARR